MATSAEREDPKVKEEGREREGKAEEVEDLWVSKKEKEKQR